jgi:hypothetical protein
MIQNKTYESTINIKNTGDSEQLFVFKVINLEELVVINENSIYLSSNEEKSIPILINANLEPGIYVGEIQISNHKSKSIPVFIEIQSENVIFDSNVNVYPTGGVLSGETLNAEIKIFDLENLGARKVELEYFIGDLKGGIIASEKEDIVIENRLTISKSINLPKSLPKGYYVLGIKLIYDDSVGTSSVLFDIKENVSGSSDSNLFIILIVILFGVFLGVFVLILFYLFLSKDRFMRQLKNQYKCEIKRQNVLMKLHEKNVGLRLNKEGRELYNKQLLEIEKKRIKELEKIHTHRVEEVKKLKKSGRKKDLVDKLMLWKKQGYDVSVLEKKYKFPDLKSIPNQIEKWKKQGYDVSVLNKK